MGLILDGKSQSSALCQDLMTRYDKGMVREAGIPAVLTFGVEAAYIQFDDAVHRHRPYLQLFGRPQEVSGEFPFGATTIRYQDTEERSLVEYRYDLTRQNLTELAAKGLYDDGFEVPAIIQENVFELPCRVTCTALAPVREGEPPVLFADIEASSMQCTDETSGYTISTYFREVPEPAPEELLSPEDRPDDVFGRVLKDQTAVYQGVLDEPESDAPDAGTPVKSAPDGGEEKAAAPDADESAAKPGHRTIRDGSDIRPPEPAREDGPEALFV